MVLWTAGDFRLRPFRTSIFWSQSGSTFSHSYSWALVWPTHQPFNNSNTFSYISIWQLVLPYACNRRFANKHTKYAKRITYRNKTLESILDCHAPLKTKTISQNPWRRDKIDVTKRKCHQLGLVWRRTCLPTDRSKYSKQLHLCNRLIANERRQYIRKQIHEIITIQVSYGLL